MNQSLRVLIVDDSDDDAILLQHTLRRGGYEVTCEVVDTPAAMRSLLENQTWDVITSDHAMPNFSAPAALALAKEIRPDIPFIIVSGEIDLNLAVSLMKGGAQDYIQKRELARLVPAVERELREVESRRERQRADAALIESELKYRSLIESASDVIFCVDEKGQYQFTNQVFAVTFGKLPDYFIGKTFWDIYPKEDADQRYEIIKRVIQTGNKESFEISVPLPNKTLYFHSTANPIRDETGKVMLVLTYGTDITERKLAEDALYEEEKLSKQMVEFSEELLRSGNEQVTYQKILDNLLFISKAKYGVLTLLNENTGKFTTAAIAGLNNHVKQVSNIPGFELVGKEWNEYLIKNEPLTDKITRHFSISELAKSVIPEVNNRPIEKLLDMGETMVIKIIVNQQMIGDFTLIMPAGAHFQNDTFVEIYSRQIELFLTRIRAEAENIKTKEYFELMFNVSPDALNINRLDNGMVVNANEGFLVMTGFARDEVIGKSTLELNLYENPADRQRIIKELNEKGYCKNEEVVLRRKDGSVFTGSISANITQLNGVAHLFSSTRDITQNKRLEATLESRLVALTQPLSLSEKIDFKDLFDLETIQHLQNDFSNATGVASLITYPDGTPITQPSNFCRLCKDIIRKTDEGKINCFSSDAEIGRYHSEGPIIQPCMSGGLWDAGAGISVGGRHIANWLVGQVRDEMQTEEKMREYARLIGADETAVVEAFREVPAMSHAQFQRVAQALFTIAKQLSNIAYQNMQQARFIVEIQQAEKALRASEALYRSILNASPDGISITDLEGRILSISPSSLTMSGYKQEEELLGRPITDFMVVEDLERAQTNIMLMHQGIFTGPGEYRAIRSDGSLYDIEVNAEFIRGADSQPTRMIFIVRNITRRKQAEEQIQRLNAELEKHVAERTAQLTAANQELEAFSYSVSHDLRAPLRSLDGFSKTLLEDHAGQLDEQGKYYLARIQKASQRMGQLINDLLNLSHITRIGLSYQQVDLSTLAQNIAAELTSQDFQRLVKFDIAANMVVKGDADLIKIALENLLNNAYKFTSQREQAHIQMGVVEQDGKKVYFVRDNGAGFNMSYANKLFIAFQRLHSEKDFPGTGIGLATVQRIINRHGGRIWAEGDVDKGATFYFTFD